MPRNINQGVGLVSVHEEVTYGVASTAVGNLTSGLEGLSTNALAHIGPLQIQRVGDVELEKSFNQSFEGVDEGKLGQRHNELELGVYLKDEDKAKVGDSGDPLSFDMLLRAAGFSATYTPESGGGAGDGKIEYEPIFGAPGQFPSFLVKSWMDNYIRKLVPGCRCASLDFSFESGQLPMVTAAVRGLDSIPEEEAAVPGSGEMDADIFSTQKACPIIGAAVTLEPGGLASPEVGVSSLNVNFANEMEAIGTADAAAGVHEHKPNGRTITSQLRLFKTHDSDVFNLLENYHRDGDVIQFAMTLGTSPNMFRVELNSKIMSYNIDTAQGLAIMDLTLQSVFSRATSTSNAGIKLSFGAL